MKWVTDRLVVSGVFVISSILMVVFTGVAIFIWLLDA